MSHHQIRDQRGSVTAEFAMVLPVVAMVIAISLGSLALQMERLKLVSAAATISRALARGEPIAKLSWLTAERKLIVTEHDGYICAELSAGFPVRVLSGKEFLISDRECARKLGL